MPDNILAIQRHENSQPEVVEGKQLIEELEKGSTALVLEASVAIQIGKLQPTGYEEVAKFFREENGKTTSAHNVWLMVEANAAGRLDEAKVEFPDAERLSQNIINTMKEDHPHFIKDILDRVGKPNWSITQAFTIQNRASNTFEQIFKK